MPDKTTESSKIRHERFAREFVLDHNARRAYMVVYGTEDVNAADANASRLMKRKDVRGLIAGLELAVHSRLEITKEKIEKEIASAAFVDMRDFYNPDGTFKDLRGLSYEEQAAIKEITIEEIWAGRGENRQKVGRIISVKIHDRVNANALLGAAHGIGVKKVEFGKPGDFNPNEDVAVVRGRVAARGARLGLKLVKR